MSDDAYLQALEVQRRNFEAQFGSIEEMGFSDKSKQVEESESESDAFGGFGEEGEMSSEEDEDEDEPKEDFDDSDDSSVSVEHTAPKVVRLNQSFGAPQTVLSRKEQRMLRAGRAPTLVEIEKKEQELSKITKHQRQQAAKEDEENLENDMKLQRLLKESHILAHQVEHSGAALTLQTLDYEAPVGNARKRTLDARIRGLSATNSATGGLPKKLENMPMSMRKGMIQARDKRISKYEEEARNAGIVLSKVRKGGVRELNIGRGATVSSDRLGSGKKDTRQFRDRGLKIHAVGKSTRNGLIIPQADIDRINQKDRGKKGKRGGRRR